MEAFAADALSLDVPSHVTYTQSENYFSKKYTELLLSRGPSHLCRCGDKCHVPVGHLRHDNEHRDAGEPVFERRRVFIPPGVQ